MSIIIYICDGNIDEIYNYLLHTKFSLIRFSKVRFTKSYFTIVGLSIVLLLHHIGVPTSIKFPSKS